MAQVVRCGLLSQSQSQSLAESRVLAAPKFKITLGTDLICYASRHDWETWDPKSMTSKQPDHRVTALSMQTYPSYLTIDRLFSGGSVSAIGGDGVGRG